MTTGDTPPRPTPEQVDRLLRDVVGWAAAQEQVRAVLLVGSWARGDARDDSDVDLVLLVDDPTSFIRSLGWAAAFGQAERLQKERWGKVTSVRAWYAGGLEVEFALASADWARQPLDPGTLRVLEDGFRPVYDPQHMLSQIRPRPSQDHSGSSGLPHLRTEGPAVYQPNPHSEFRVLFDFRVEFTNGGFVEGRDFLLDLELPDVSDAELARMVVEAMNLARAGRVEIRRKRIVRRGEHDDLAPSPGEAARPC
jgi:predicted nucleotidyltransferase